MKLNRRCRRGHNEWERIKDERYSKGYSYRCRICRRAANNAAQKAYARREGEEFKAKDRLRHKRKRWAHALTGGPK